MNSQKTRIASLDIGDVWTGVALSDNMRIIATPHTTIQTKDLFLFLADFFQQYSIQEVVVGIPVTLRGIETEQTKKTKQTFQDLKNHFPDISFIPVDERLSSAAALDIQKTKKKGTLKKKKEEKLKNHAIAAAIILTDYIHNASA
jgi:putative holliday junction resolvase